MRTRVRLKYIVNDSILCLLTQTKFDSWYKQVDQFFLCTNEYIPSKGLFVESSLIKSHARKKQANVFTKIGYFPPKSKISKFLFIRRYNLSKVFYENLPISHEKRIEYKNLK